MAFAAVVAAVGAATSYIGYRQQKKAAKKQQAAQREANKTQQASAAIDNRARRARLIRQAQLARATAENVQATQGAGGVTTSMATGALAVADTQQAVNLANFAEQGRQGALYGNSQIQLGLAKSQFARGGSLMKLGGTILANAQRIGGGIKQGMGAMTGGTQPVSGTFRSAAQGVPHTTGLTSTEGSF